MFSSLDRADIGLAPDENGRPQFVQTDHRATEEIEQTAELSAVFALIRLLNPRRMVEEGAPEPLVIVNHAQRPPEFLRVILSSCGARLLVGPDMEPDEDLPAPRPLDDIYAESMHNLATVVSSTFGIEQTMDGLKTLEARLAENPPSPEEDEIGYWTAVVQLGTFAGEVVRESNGGNWVYTKSGNLPLALSTSYKGDQAMVNFLGKALKFFNDGPDESVAFLAHMIQQSP